MASAIARLFTDRSVTGSSGPRVRRLTATTSSRIFCSSANLPIRSRTMARSFIAPTVSGCSGPSSCRRSATARLMLLDRLLLVAEVPVAHAEGVPDRRLHERLAGERRGDLGLRTVERLADRRVAAQPPLLTLRPGGREHLVLEELEHGVGPRLRPSRLPELLGRIVPRGQRLAFGRAGPQGLPGARAGPRRDEQDKTRGRGDQPPVLARRTSAGDTAATAARPRPARRAGSARCPAPGRRPSRSGGSDPSPGTS